MNNVTTLLEIYEQRRNVAGFSNDEKVAKIQSLGLLHTSKLFFLHVTHPRSFHDHIHQEKHWILTFSYKNTLIFETFEIMGTKNRKLLTINRF